MAIFPFPENNYTVEKNEESDLVRIIQILLSGIDVAYGIFAGVALSGVYDDATENAVRAFQKIHFLPQTGVVDIHTWNRIASDYNLFERNPVYIG
jgi:peptidoglycan hydrolase-like protein with peptidoglycan-binding domain